MSFPIRCFNCNKVIGKYEQKYNNLLESGKTPKEALDELKMSRYCCRRMFLGHINIIDGLLLFPKDIKDSKPIVEKT